MDLNQFAQRVELLKKRLYRTAYLYLNNEASALEAVDETVYKGLKSLRKLRQPEYFDTWLTRILINECKQELRRSARVQPSDSVSLDKSADFNYDTLPLKEAINKLPEELKLVVILRYFAGYTVLETAANLDIPQGTVATRQRRALALLKLELKEEE
ncbi:MAG: sigma-70 family RNA polymerase sigma factor [Bacillota bacterium]